MNYSIRIPVKNSVSLLPLSCCFLPVNPSMVSFPLPPFFFLPSFHILLSLFPISPPSVLYFFFCLPLVDFFSCLISISLFRFSESYTNFSPEDLFSFMLSKCGWERLISLQILRLTKTSLYKDWLSVGHII